MQTVNVPYIVSHLLGHKFPAFETQVPQLQQRLLFRVFHALDRVHDLLLQIDKMIDRLISGKYVLEERMMLTGSVEINSTSYKHEALNDVVLARENSLRLVTVEINVNDKYFDTIEADGIIVSTPTGSTSYNLSAGGPIVQPDARLLVMTPISPYSLSSRRMNAAANSG